MDGRTQQDADGRGSTDSIRPPPNVPAVRLMSLLTADGHQTERASTLTAAPAYAVPPAPLSETEIRALYQQLARSAGRARIAASDARQLLDCAAAWTHMDTVSTLERSLDLIAADSTLREQAGGLLDAADTTARRSLRQHLGRLLRSPKPADLALAELAERASEAFRQAVFQVVGRAVASDHGRAETAIVALLGEQACHAMARESRLDVHGPAPHALTEALNARQWAAAVERACGPAPRRAAERTLAADGAVSDFEVRRFLSRRFRVHARQLAC
jgi:hypothetical protein